MWTRAPVVVLVLIAILAVPAISKKPTGPESFSKAGSGAGEIKSADTSGQSKPSSTPQFTLPMTGMPTGIGAIKSLPDGSPVCVSQKIATLVLSTYFYVQEADRSAGIRVVCGYFYPFFGDNCIVTIYGILETVGGERQIRLTEPIQLDLENIPPVAPICMKQEALCGKPFNIYTPGFADSIYLHNVGLRVRTYGKVTATDQFDGMYSYFYLDDGSWIHDGSFNYFNPEITYKGIRIYSFTMPPLNSYRLVEGIVSMPMFDPTPDIVTNQDEFPIRAVLAFSPGNVMEIGQPEVQVEKGVVSGRVRLASTPDRPVNVRVYSTYDDTVITEVTDQFKSFMLDRIPVTGTVVTASAPGYFSQSKVLTGGESVDFELQPSSTHLGILADKTHIKACSSETLTLSLICRDIEGKRLPGRTLRATTTRGSFVESGSDNIEVTTNESGLATVTFTASPDGPGVAGIQVVDVDHQSAGAEMSLEIIGPKVEVTASPGLLSSAGTSIINVKITDAEQPLSNALLFMSTDCGVFEETASQVCPLITDTEGTATATLMLDQPGTAQVVVRYADACGNETSGWVLVSYGAAPWIAEGSRHSSVLVADLDNSCDGQKEVALVTNSGTLNVWRNDGTLLWSQNGYVTNDTGNTLACGNLDHDPAGSLEVVLPSTGEQRVRAYDGATGKPMAGWPTYTDFEFINVSAAIADVNSDGANEVIAGDHSCFVFSWNATGNWEKVTQTNRSCLWRNLTGSSGTAINGSSVAIGDINGDPDGIPEVLVGSNDSIEVFSFPGDAWGDHVNPPLYTPGWPKDTGLRTFSSPAIGDIDGDGRNDVAIGSDDGKMYVYYGGTGEWVGYSVDSPIRSSPALADLDDDGKLDIIFGADNARVYAFKAGGVPVAGWETGIKLGITDDCKVQGGPVVGDVTGDGKAEVLVATTTGFLFCIYRDGNAHIANDGHYYGPIAWAYQCAPAGASSIIASSPTIDDIDGDGKVDVIIASSAGVYRLEFDAAYINTPQAQPWPTFHANPSRTGCVSTPAPPVYASIIGKVTRNGIPVESATIYIKKSDGSPVYVPWSSPPVERPPVNTVGTAYIPEHNDGGYCINQLEPNTSYELRVVVTGMPEKIVPDIQVTTGVVRVDIEM